MTKQVKSKTKKEKKVLSESELAQKYAQTIISKQTTRGHVKRETATNKDLWMDRDFFFSIVFQSQNQKYQFLEQFCAKFDVKLAVDNGNQIQIMNGVKLSEALGFSITMEKSLPPPHGDLDLRPFVLDNEKV